MKFIRLLLRDLQHLAALIEHYSHATVETAVTVMSQYSNSSSQQHSCTPSSSSSSCSHGPPLTFQFSSANNDGKEYDDSMGVDCDLSYDHHQLTQFLTILTLWPGQVDDVDEVNGDDYEQVREQRMMQLTVSVADCVHLMDDLHNTPIPDRGQYDDHKSNKSF